MKYDNTVIIKMLSVAVRQLETSSPTDQLAVLRAISATCLSAADRLKLSIDVQLDDIHNTKDLK